MSTSTSDEEGTQRTTIDFFTEARDNLKEVAYAIKEGLMSGTLPSSSACVYFNVTTLEGRRYCVRLSMRGFEVAGLDYDSLEEDRPDSPAFETVYSLLNHISPSYQASFHHALSDKLVQVKESYNPGTTHVAQQPSQAES